jgi:hypothetical protein
MAPKKSAKSSKRNLKKGKKLAATKNLAVNAYMKF